MAALLAAQPSPRSAGRSRDVLRKTRVVVWRLDGLGIPREMAENLAQLLRNSIATIDGFDVISPMTVELELRSPRRKGSLTCDVGPDCAVQLGRMVAADRVVFGTIGALGQDFTVNLRLLDSKRGVELLRQQSNVSGNRDLLIPEIRLAAFRLLAPERIRGALLIEADVPDLTVELDGKVVGKTPLPGPIENLTPGEHHVRLRRNDYTELERSLAIEPFETARLRVELERKGD